MAGEILRSGGLVAFPTETVYGLGACAMNASAVRGIFEAKGRPGDNPLIVHVCDPSQLDLFCTPMPSLFPLMDRFWPGPLTLLMPRRPALPDIVTAGLDTVAVRMPAHPAALEMLREAGVPVAAPSANRSGRPSPTKAAHVLEDMEGRVPLILDGGDCQVGLESTVLDLCHGRPTILRPGGITREMLEPLLGTVDLAGSILRPLGDHEVARSPGMRYRHYAPRGLVTLVEGDESQVLEAMKRLYRRDEAEGRRVLLLCFEEHIPDLAGFAHCSLGSGRHPEETARVLFDRLREADTMQMDRIYSEVTPVQGLGLAVMNRLGRAASFRTLSAREVLGET